MNVLIVEDNPQEQEAAVQTVLKILFPRGIDRRSKEPELFNCDVSLFPYGVTVGDEVTVVSNMTDALGYLHDATMVLTDLYFPYSKRGSNDDVPNGIAVLARCIKRGVPVGLCTDTNHHRTHYLKDLSDALGEFPVSNTKDWTAVIEQLRSKAPDR